LRVRFKKVPKHTASNVSLARNHVLLYAAVALLALEVVTDRDFEDSTPRLVTGVTEAV